jgi:hypothetical protein
MQCVERGAICAERRLRLSPMGNIAIYRMGQLRPRRPFKVIQVQDVLQSLWHSLELSDDSPRLNSSSADGSDCAHQE